MQAHLIAKSYARAVLEMQRNAAAMRPAPITDRNGAPIESESDALTDQLEQSADQDETGSW